MPPIALRTLSKESLSIGAILFVSYTVGTVTNVISEIPLLAHTGDFLRDGIVIAGTAAAVLYVLLRSVALARTIDVTENQPTAAPAFVREAAVLAFPVILWFSLAGLSTTLGLHSTLDSAVETLVLASTRVGMLTAVLYVLARGISVLPVLENSRTERVAADD